MEINIRKNEEQNGSEEIEDFDMPVNSKPEIRDHKPNFEFESPEPRRGEERKETSDIHITQGLSSTLWWWRQISRWALLVMVGLTPVFFLPITQLPVGANKEIFVFGAILVALLAYSGKVLTEGKIRYPGHWLTLTFVILVIVWFFASFFSVSPWASFIGNWSSFDSFASMLLFLILAFLVAAIFDRHDLALSVLLFLGGLSVLGIFEILQFFKIFIFPWAFTQTPVFNPIGTVNDLAGLIAFGVIMTIGLLSSLELSRILRKLLAIAMVIFLVNLVLINFLPVWLGIIGAMVVLISLFSAGLAHGFKEGMEGLQLVYFRKIWLPTSILLIALLFIFIPSPFASLLQIPTEVSLTNTTTFNIDLATLKSGKFLVGSGPNTFWYDYNFQKPQNINNSIFWSANFTQGASVILTWLSTVGILGVLGILFMIAVFILTGLKTGALKRSTRSITNVLSQASFVSVLFMFIMWFLYTTNFTNLMITFWGIGLFLSSSLYFSYEAGEIKTPFREIHLFNSPQKTFFLSLIIVILMVASVTEIYVEVERYVAENYFSQAMTANAAHDTAGTINNLSRALNFWNYDEKYWQSTAQAIFFQLNTLLSQQRNISQDALRSQFQNITGSAIQAAKRAEELNPTNPFNAVLLGSIYENLIPLGVTGASDFAVSSYSQAISLDPQNPADYVAIARVYMAQADLAANNKQSLADYQSALSKAEPLLTKALDLKNDFAPARFLLVQIFDKEGKTADAITHAIEIIQLNPNDVGSLFQLGFLYYKNSQFNEARAVFEKAVNLSPNYSNARYFLGLIYDKQKDKNSAITQFVQIENLNPDNQEVKQILVNLRAKKPALFGIAPPPQNRTETPIPEGVKPPIKPVKINRPIKIKKR